MKIVSDFDGVLTDLTEEGHRVREIFHAALARISERASEEIERLLTDAESAMSAQPHLYGWRMKGRISAYCNEDLFVRVIGLANCLDTWAETGQNGADALAKGIREAGFPGFAALAGYSYNEMLRETRAGKIKPIDPATQGVLEGLLDQGHEIVVVSNSGTDRILNIFNSAGISAVDHDTNPKARFRVRGDARKFELGEVSRGFAVGDYFTETSRPSYENILLEEQPGAVIGDVFSLDLALPLHLARTNPVAHGGVRLFLRRRDYSPEWSLRFVHEAHEDHATLRAISSLSELPTLLG